MNGRTDERTDNGFKGVRLGKFSKIQTLTIIFVCICVFWRQSITPDSVGLRVAFNRVLSSWEKNVTSPVFSRTSSQVGGLTDWPDPILTQSWHNPDPIDHHQLAATLELVVRRLLSLVTEHWVWDIDTYSDTAVVRPRTEHSTEQWTGNTTLHCSLLCLAQWALQCTAQHRSVLLSQCLPGLCSGHIVAAAGKERQWGWVRVELVWSQTIGNRHNICHHFSFGSPWLALMS